MLGFGEEPKEIRQTMRDMRDAGVEIFTLGQYLRPSKRHMKVTRMLPPEEYDGWREEGMAMGFKFVASGPLVRSSYKAGEVFMEAFLDRRDAERVGLDDDAPLPLVGRPSQIPDPLGRMGPCRRRTASGTARSVGEAILPAPRVRCSLCSPPPINTV